MGFFSSNKDKQETPIPNNQPEPVIVKPTIPEPVAVSNTIPAPVAPAPKPVIETQSTYTSNSNSTNSKMTIITAGTILEGQLKVDTDIQIDGVVKGTITCKNKVILGVNGKIEGDINCQEAEISGKVIGKINVKDILFLKGAANIDGDIVTGKLVMESGVKFNGKCNMTGMPTPAASSNGTVTSATTAKVNA